MKDENCIFCKLANGEIPTATLGRLTVESKKNLYRAYK